MSVTTSTRDAEATRLKLLEAATEAFAAEGFAGVRVEHIAQRAGVNKAMIYHYFGNKEGLYQAVIGAAAAQLHVPSDLSALRAFQGQLEAQLGDPAVRLLAWEGLRSGAQEGVEKAQLPTQPNDRLGRDQEDIQDLALVFVALAAFPRLCPQVVAEVTGLQASGETFQARWLRLQRRMLRMIETALHAQKERVTLRPAARPSNEP
ncbi:MAG: TetR/AcrR family transcriptional regulator [Pseudomonadales bacterium]